MELPHIETRPSPRRTVVTSGRVDPTPVGAVPAVIDTVGRTQQLPAVGTGWAAPHDPPLADAPLTDPPGAGAPLTDPPSTPHQPAPASAIERSADAGDVATTGDESRLGASVAAATTLVGTELISGLRVAGRQLIRPSASEGHLRAELTIAARRIDAAVREQDAYDQGWAIAATGLIHDAGHALEHRRISDGWELLRAAQIEMLDGLDRRGLLVERASMTGRELADDTSTDVEELRSEVWAMRQTRNRYLAELDRRLVEEGRGLLHRGVTLVVALVLGAIGVLVTSPSSNPDDALGGIGNYLTTVGLAMTGAAVSYVLFTHHSSRSASITEVVNPLQLVLLRLAFGGVVGLLLVALLQSGVQDLVNVTGQAAYLWAILGGFSERWVDRLIDRVERSSQEAADAACRDGS